jgi:hypothetical protein
MGCNQIFDWVLPDQPVRLTESTRVFFFIFFKLDLVPAPDRPVGLIGFQNYDKNMTDSLSWKHKD